MNALFVLSHFLLALFVQSPQYDRAGKEPKPQPTVYIFLNTECPVCQQYTPRLADLYRRFRKSDVRFVGVYPLRTDLPQTIRQFHKLYQLPFAGQADPGARLARYFRAHVTPEVVLMAADGTVSYQGAIDDWYVSLGKHRPSPTQHFLRDALDALLAGQPVAVPRTDAVGCLIE
ncbi:redoxin domain-containing protein [Fibrisoma limi]|nr:redoxin domain-containing protein [Fibrisoma limi]